MPLHDKFDHEPTDVTNIRDIEVKKPSHIHYKNIGKIVKQTRYKGSFYGVLERKGSGACNPQVAGKISFVFEIL